MAMNRPQRPSTFDPYKDPDGSLKVFYMETPCPNMPFYDYDLSPTFKQFKADEETLELVKRHPQNPYVRAESEVRGAVGTKVLEEALLAKTDEDGNLELEPDKADLARAIYEYMVKRYGPENVRMHRKSLPLRKELRSKKAS